MTDQDTPIARVEDKLASIDGWRRETLAHLRALILKADPDVTESLKWAKPTNPLGVPTWEHSGILCTGEVYKAYVKLTFAQGAALADPTGLFNAGFGGGTRRAIDLREGEQVDAEAFEALIKAAIAFNVARKASKKA
ncbi:DUF1801 domain-containing protein [Novosphingobium terrae]|uniref:DUF1801 domain-containing protein n=1 Tax=Novosphingobium terrae TaxID=2726189 RepID=UPI001980C1E8|nr:DUF1801 domain-containing protein [Novosphingobium terrae]